MRSRIPALVAAGALVLGVGACGGGGGKSVAEWCKDAKGLKPPSSYTSVEEVQKTVDSVKKLASDAPSAIKTDMQTFANALQRASNGDTSANSDPKVSAAAAHVSTYVRDKCGVGTTPTTR